jgi:hypothetical protein
MTADEAVAELLARLSLGVDDVDPAALDAVRADLDQGDSPMPETCTCPDLGEQLRAVIDGRPPSTSCPTHDPEAALAAAGVDEARARAEVVRSVLDGTPPPEEEDPLLASLGRLLPPTLPLNASAQDWARHIGLPSTPDGDNAA